MQSKIAIDVYPPSHFLHPPFTEQEISVILSAIFATLDRPFRKSEPSVKTILVDAFGTQNSGKTTVTSIIEQVFRRHKFNALCPPETAEIDEVRSRLTNDNPVEQAKHLTGDQDYFLNLAHHPRAHFAMTSRGLIDMLYWYERGLRKGIYSETHVDSVRRHIYELLKFDLVDSFLFFTCSVEAAMRREYDRALTQKRGSKMNEAEVAETIGIYKYVLEGVNANISALPIHHVDTSNLDAREVAQKVMDFLLPTICSRFNVPESHIMPSCLSLVRKSAVRSLYFEEQAKFSGHPTDERIKESGWRFERASDQEDIYLNPDPSSTIIDPFGEVLRVRRDKGEEDHKFMYKGDRRDRILSHCRPCTLRIDAVEARNILVTYPTVLILNKNRRHYRKDSPSGDHFFTLHVDRIEGLGDFTEIRARGSSKETHTKELLALGHELGFSTNSIVEGNYLSIALNR